MKYTHLFVAGTFDQFHDGHRYLLQETLKRGKEITVGITSDSFISRYKNIQGIQSFTIREKNIISWVKEKVQDKKITIISIDNPYEPVVSGNFDGLIVTKNNRLTGEEINKQRKEKKLGEIALIEISLLPAEDNTPISSTRIRSGEIDSSGNLYLPEFLRVSLKRPLGDIISVDALPKNISGKTIITVGDVTTDSLLSRGIVPDLSIIDLHAMRKPYKAFPEFSFPETIRIERLSSGPGFISNEALAAINTWASTREKTVILLKGEDDLLVLPAIMVAPDGAHVYYGQPNEGLVEVIVTERIKERVEILLKQFQPTR